MFRSACAGFLFAALACLPGDASAISVTGAVVFAGISPPNLDVDVVQSNTEIRLFSEKLDHTLASSVTLDVGGVLGIGTVVSSYIFHFDPVSGSNNRTGSAMFDSDVLGVISTTSRLNSSDGELGLAGTFYNGSARGLETNDSVTIDGNMVTVNVDFTASFPMDEIRVLTRPDAIPEPGTLSILGLGLIGFGLIRRRKRS